MVDQVAQNLAARPVVLLEHNVNAPQGDRYNRFWTAFNGTSGSYPLMMIDSGHQTINGGPLDYQSVYTSAIETELARAPQAAVGAWVRRIGDTLRIYATVENHSGMTLSPANSATITALVWDDVKVGVTSRTMRSAPYTSIAAPLADGERLSATLDTPPLTGVDWTKIHALALVDYCSGWSGPCDALQAAMAVDPAITLRPASLSFNVHPADADPTASIAMDGPSVVMWSASADVDWISLQAASGSLPAAPFVTVLKAKLVAGSQQGHVNFTGTSADGLSLAATLTISATYGTSTVKGDANGDGQLTAADIFHLINHLFVGGPPPVESADVNADGMLTVADIFYLINHLFVGGPPPM